jgi:hypothetical protein
MGLAGLLRPAMLAMIGLSLLLSGCAAARPRVADETKIEEWARCSHTDPIRFTILCLEMRRPL